MSPRREGTGGARGPGSASALLSWSASAAVATVGLAVAVGGAVIGVTVLLVAGLAVALVAGVATLFFGEKSAEELQRGGPRTGRWRDRRGGGRPPEGPY